MAGRRERVVIVGAGLNGLVAAFYLAKAGLPALVLERRDIIGGTAVTEEIHPGFRCPTVLHSTGQLLPQIVRDMQLDKRGLVMMRPDLRLLALDPKSESLRIYDDPQKTAAAVTPLSSHDAKKYLEFHTSFEHLGRAIRPLLSVTPPDIDHLTIKDYLNLARLGLNFRGLHKKDEYRLLRWGPMPVADLAAEWFETELLRATIEARGIFGTFAGPWSAGTSAGLLMQAAVDGRVISAPFAVAGRGGALTDALAKAASGAGAEIRTGAHVTGICVSGNKATGVVLRNGEEIAASTVVSSADPKQTFLKLVQATDLEPGFLAKVHAYRAVGTVAKVNLALSRLPSFTTIKNGTADLSGRIHIGPDTDYLERAFDAAKYGDFSSQPYLDITIPSLTDASLAPGGAHVMSIHVQYAPYQLKRGDWNSRRDEFADAVLKTLSEYAPDIREVILQRQVLTPLDLEQTYGLTGGHIFHGEHALDQLFAFRPFLGWARYRTPIRGLYLCGSGTHPGGGIAGAAGANASREIMRDLK
ncbi:MAG TPA: NAD(P)/FAD-dependent oxidoreductase [Terriglobia bacterium]|nr:NAD(P)/FAD-dependent oxidoreductase [Terriglobia bacterium]